uniref:Retrotransposon protein, putative, Ty1-copia subclass n=1 Tax=Tanacetum cinerariifolium TaxID=118510 RepID=A0A6L2KJE9_TANCI|nr:retrotransposon protein, putative, Ty1-copia subclass [Tanacetum cinerariifolium]
MYVMKMITLTKSINWTWSNRLIGLGQNDYMDKILKRYKMDNSKRGHILMQERLDLNKTQGASTPKEVKRMQNVPYASRVGSIMYAVRCTRPDVAFAQNITSRFQQNPGECHWTAVKNILKYLRSTKDMFLVYGGKSEVELQVNCYCDVGFETNRDDTKSQTGYVFILNGGALDWKSSKQSTAAMSATEAEYIATSKAAIEVVWIRKFILGLSIVPTINEPIRMFFDNSAAPHFANEQGVQKGTRHYHRRYHYVRESIALGEIRFLKVHTDDDLADPFTKALSNIKGIILLILVVSRGVILTRVFKAAFCLLLKEEVDLFLASDNSIPPGIENFADDSEGDIRFLKELLIDDSILSHESSDFNFEDNPSLPQPPLEPPDIESFFDSKPNVIAEEISNKLNEDECFDPGREINVSTKVEDDDYVPFMFVIRFFLPDLIFPEVSPFIPSAKNEDTIFDPGISVIYPSEIEVFLCWIFVSVSKIFTSFDLKLVWGSPYPLINIA